MLLKEKYTAGFKPTNEKMSFNSEKFPTWASTATGSVAVDRSVEVASRGGKNPWRRAVPSYYHLFLLADHVLCLGRSFALQALAEPSRALAEAPSMTMRVWDLWDNLNGHIERACR